MLRIKSIQAILLDQGLPFSSNLGRVRFWNLDLRNLDLKWLLAVRKWRSMLRIRRANNPQVGSTPGVDWFPPVAVPGPRLRNDLIRHRGVKSNICFGREDPLDPRGQENTAVWTKASQGPTRGLTGLVHQLPLNDAFHKDVGMSSFEEAFSSVSSPSPSGESCMMCNSIPLP